MKPAELALSTLLVFLPGCTRFAVDHCRVTPGLNGGVVLHANVLNHLNATVKQVNIEVFVFGEGDRYPGDHYHSDAYLVQGPFRSGQRKSITWYKSSVDIGYSGFSRDQHFLPIKSCSAQAAFLEDGSMVTFWSWP